MHKYKNILNKLLPQNKGFLSPRSTKNHSFEYNDYNVYLTKTTKTLSLFTKNNQTYILSKILDISKIRSITYRPEVHNLQTRIALFPGQEKLLQKVDGGYA